MKLFFDYSGRFHGWSDAEHQDSSLKHSNFAGGISFSRLHKFFSNLPFHCFTSPHCIESMSKITCKRVPTSAKRKNTLTVTWVPCTPVCKVYSGHWDTFLLVIASNSRNSHRWNRLSSPLLGAYSLDFHSLQNSWSQLYFLRILSWETVLHDTAKKGGVLSLWVYLPRSVFMTWRQISLFIVFYYNCLHWSPSDNCRTLRV